MRDLYLNARSATLGWSLLMVTLMMMVGCRQMKSEVLVSVTYRDGPVDITLTQRVR